MDVPGEIRRAFELFAAGRLSDAERAARGVLSVSAEEPSACRVLAGVSLHRGELDGAVEWARRGYEIDPSVSEAAANLASVLVASGQGEEAERMARRAIELDAELVSGWVNLGLACRLRRRSHDAVDAFRRAVQLQPGHYGAWTNLGNVLTEVGEFAEAVECIRRALSIRPGLSAAETNLGNALLKLGRLDESIAAYQRSLVSCPGDIETEYNLGIAYEHSGRLSEAEAVQRGVVDRDPGHARAINNLGVVLKLQGRIAEAAEQFERSAELASDSTAAVANRLATMLCQSDVSVEQLLETHRQSSLGLWGQLESNRPRVSSERQPESPIRVGFVSPDFGQHPVGRFLLGAFEALDPDRLQAVCFSDRIQVDAFTDRFRSVSSEWFDIRGRSDELVAEWVEAAGVDVLIDLAGHTGRHRLGVFARRPAPLQMTWIGYPSTTGLPAIDVLLADDVLVPVGSERYFSERIERLEGGHISYLPPTHCPDVAGRPESGAVVFGSFNKLDKTNHEVLLAWAEILSRIPGSRLVLRSRGLDDSRVADRVVGVLSEAGVERERVECRGWVSHRELMAGYGEIDIGLDPFPFSGGLTTCEALWMGVPVVTWAGERMCGRQSASFLSRVGLGDLVGTSRAEYVSKAIGLAGDPIRRGALRAELRGRVGEGPLGDARRLANEFTLAVERSWLRGR